MKSIIKWFDNLKLSREWRMAIAALLMFALFSWQFIAAEKGNSVGVKGNASHMLSDFALIALNLGVMLFEQRGISSRYTFGYTKLKSLVAWMNGLFLLVIAGWMVWETGYRLWMEEPVEIEAGWVLGASIAGFLANAFCALLLHEGSKEDVNARAAFIDMKADLLADASFFIVALIIQLFGKSWSMIEAIATVIISFIIGWHSWFELVRPNWQTLMGRR